MNEAQKKRNQALLITTGYEDLPPLTLNSGEGNLPEGRELSFSWLAGIILSALTGILLMGGALYISFLGQDNFSTAFAALEIEKTPKFGTTLTTEKTNRAKPVVKTRSENEIIEAAILQNIDGKNIVRKQPFMRIKATLATSLTTLSDTIPPYDPVALLARTQSKKQNINKDISTDIYGADIDGEIIVNTSPIPDNLIPRQIISDKEAANYMTLLYSNVSFDSEFAAFEYESEESSVIELTGENENIKISGVAQNVSAFVKTRTSEDKTLSRLERILTIKQQDSLENILLKNGFSQNNFNMIAETLRNVYPSTTLPKGARLRILFGPSKNSGKLIPYRLSIYIKDTHVVSVALTDSGRYVLAIAPPAIEFPKEDIEEIDIGNLPSIYHSIWETARKHNIADNIIDRIIAMFAYDLDLTKKISLGDSIEMLLTAPDENGEQELLHVALKVGSNIRKFYRFRTSDGEVDYFDIEGQTGKRFLMRRPLEGGGNLRSRFGYRRHPITGRSKLHTGTDLAAPYGTPVYAAGDGVVEMAQWFSGYGRYVKLKHVNGFTTAYAHMSRIAKGLKPGDRVRQGQIIGYVGSTGLSTGNHLHYEMRINNRPVDALSVKLPRDKILPQQYRRQFEQTIAQIDELMKREPSPVTIAKN